eukprot:gene17208-22729_t
MSDDWEDEDFEVPDLLSKVNIKQNDNNDDEEEETVETTIIPTKSAATIELEAKKAKEEEIKLANKLLQTKLNNMTAEEKRLYDRNLIEEADKQIANELFGNSVDNSKRREEDIAKGLGGIPIRTKQDHSNFAILCSNKMDESTPFNIAAYFKELTEQIKFKLTLEGLDDIIKVLTEVRDEKKKTAATKAKTEKKTVKQLKKESQQHSDIFGGDDFYSNTDKYDQYDNDDFM